MKIETRVAGIAGRREACKALGICVDRDMTPSGDDAETVLALAGEGMKAACAALGPLAIATPASKGLNTSLDHARYRPLHHH